MHFLIYSSCVCNGACRVTLYYCVHVKHIAVAYKWWNVIFCVWKISILEKKRLEVLNLCKNLQMVSGIRILVSSFPSSWEITILACPWRVYAASYTCFLNMSLTCLCLVLSGLPSCSLELGFDIFCSLACLSGLSLVPPGLGMKVAHLRVKAW